MATTSLFEQAFHEVEPDIRDIAAETNFKRWAVLDRLRAPDRVISFAVRWIDDDGTVHVNRAWRVQHSNALGPYKGGLRFDPSVTEDTLRFLAFEQCLKNALTGLPMGGGKGGSDFNPKKKSDAEIMRFCQAFMDEYVRYGGANRDVPAGDIGVGSREVGFLYGRYLKLTQQHTGAFTGKPAELGGIAGRTEATGYGCVRFAELMLQHKNDSIEGKSLLISGSGNVAIHAAIRAVRDGATVITLSGRDGVIHAPNGLTKDDILHIERAKNDGHDLDTIANDLSGTKFHKDQNPWKFKGDIALPCATQNELDTDDAKTLIENGVQLVAEGANMPTTNEACALFESKGIPRGPGKAANAGGVAVSGLEMNQNAERLPKTKQETLKRLDDIMENIHDACVSEGTEKNNHINYARGANRAGFRKLARAIVAMGLN